MSQQTIVQNGNNGSDKRGRTKEKKKKTSPYIGVTTTSLTDFFLFMQVPLTLQTTKQKTLWHRTFIAPFGVSNGTL